MENNYLEHHGVLGMKWGVRKSRPSSGRTSSAKRASSFTFGRTKTKNKAKTRTNSEETKPKKKSIKDMSDDELKTQINRLELEKRYRDLSKVVNPQPSKKGKDFTMRVLEKIGENTLTNIGTQAANKALGTAINKAFKVDSNDTVNRIVNPNKGQSDKK